METHSCRWSCAIVSSFHAFQAWPPLFTRDGVVVSLSRRNSSLTARVRPWDSSSRGTWYSELTSVTARTWLLSTSQYKAILFIVPMSKAFEQRQAIKSGCNPRLLTSRIAACCNLLSQYTSLGWNFKTILPGKEEEAQKFTYSWLGLQFFIDRWYQRYWVMRSQYYLLQKETWDKCSPEKNSWGIYWPCICKKLFFPTLLRSCLRASTNMALSRSPIVPPSSMMHTSGSSFVWSTDTRDTLSMWAIIASVT